jgi:hypothetical protein
MRRSAVQCMPLFRPWFAILLTALSWGLPCTALGEDNGFILRDGRPVFPLGIYELPADNASLQAMADAGLNLVRCHSRADLDRVGAHGLMGCVPVGVQAGATDKLRQTIEAVADHPALAAWEGPDEVVWNFTAYSGLFKTQKVHQRPGAWWRQDRDAVRHAKEQAEKLIPRIRAGIALVRSLDTCQRPFWINEAFHSDLKFVRQYIDDVDITGCDVYPVKTNQREVLQVAAATERWKAVGRGKPVWMVLQAFAWSELHSDDPNVPAPVYPTFAESRFMAYAAIVHGARGILYWGSHYLKSLAFRQSLYALTSELSALQPLLVAPAEKNVRVNVIERDYGQQRLGVRGTVRRDGEEWLIILVNEDDTPHMAVEVTGLESLNGRHLDLLYTPDGTTIRHGELITRMQPRAVQVFATGRRWETTRQIDAERRYQEADDTNSK